MTGASEIKIAGDFNDEIIFNGRKFCVKGIDDTNIFIGDEVLITVNLANSAVEIAEGGGATELAVNGTVELICGDKTLSTSNNFAGFMQMNSDGNIYSSDYFTGTMSGMTIDASPLPIEPNPTTLPMPDENQRFARYVRATMPPSP